MGNQPPQQAYAAHPHYLDLAACTQRCMPLVGRIARDLKRRLPHSVDVDDLVQYGFEGLLQAAQRFDGPSVNFEYFARARIRGAMLDGLRATDSAPRGLRRRMRRINQRTQQLEQNLGRAPTGREIAAANGLTLAVYQRIVDEHHAHRPVCTDAAEQVTRRRPAAGAGDPLQAALQASAVGRLHEALADLSEREQAMLRLHYEADLKLHDIGTMFGVTESRVSQVLSQATARLRARVD